MYGYGISGFLRKTMPVYAKQWIRDIVHYNINNKYIYAEGTEIRNRYFEVRTLSKDFLTPVHTQIYGDKVLITIWEPAMVAILITSSQVAENYRKHFDLLWEVAKK